MALINTEVALTPKQVCSALIPWAATMFGASDNDVMVRELGFYNKSLSSAGDKAFRADLALLNDHLIGFEIKSEKDSLKRWQDQQIAYSNIFDEVWLCIHAKHYNNAQNMTAKHIGMVVFDNFQSFTIHRRAMSNHGFNNAYDLSSMLWRDELDELAYENFVPITSRMNKRMVRKEIAQCLPFHVIKRFTLTKLKQRKAPMLAVI